MSSPQDSWPLNYAQVIIQVAEAKKVCIERMKDKKDAEYGADECDSDLQLLDQHHNVSPTFLEVVRRRSGPSPFKN